MRIAALKVRGQETQDNEQVRVMQWGRVVLGFKHRYALDTDQCPHTS